MRRFEFVEGSSSKFWEIELDGESFTVCYGKIGTAGTTQTKEWDSEEKAQKEYDKLVAEKVKKGYEEVGSASAPAAKAAPAPKAAAAPKAATPPKPAAAAATANGARRFEFEEGSSSKFWEISRDGDSFTVCYGKIGTAGTNQTKAWDSEEKCQKEYDKLVAEKVKKGYVEI